MWETGTSSISLPSQGQSLYRSYIETSWGIDLGSSSSSGPPRCNQDIPETTPPAHKSPQFQSSPSLGKENKIPNQFENWPQFHFQPAPMQARFSISKSSYKRVIHPNCKTIPFQYLPVNSRPTSTQYLPRFHTIPLQWKNETPFPISRWVFSQSQTISFHFETEKTETTPETNSPQSSPHSTPVNSQFPFPIS